MPSNILLPLQFYLGFLVISPGYYKLQLNLDSYQLLVESIPLPIFPFLDSIMLSQGYLWVVLDLDLV